MNKVFKVIWSEARNAYVVVSEIAKNHGSKSCSTKKLLAMLIATGVMTCASMAPAMAATNVDSNANVTVKKGATVTVAENATVTVGDNAIALGKGAYAVKNSIAIGNGAYTQDGSLTKGQSVALGNGAVTGAKSTSIGSNAVGGREGTITIGANANNGSAYATVIGTDSKLMYKTKYSGAAATIVGAQSEIKNENDNQEYSGVANGIYGSANTIKNSNGVTIQGSGNTVTDAYKDMNIGFLDGLAILGGDYSVLAKKESGAVAVVGGANTVSKQTDSTVIGYANKLTSDKEKGSQNVFMAGSHNTLTNVSDSLVMGNDNTISDRSNVISFGYKNAITANNAVAIGNGASVSSEGGVALGVGSVADRANAVSVGSKGAERQIINVKAGVDDTDAVNVSQLKKATANANKGWKLSTEDGAANQVASEATVNFSGKKDAGGHQNITVSNEGNNVKIELASELKNVTGVVNGNSRVTLGTGIAGITNGQESVIMMNGSTTINGVVGIDNTGKISGVANGEADKDAVNYGQLKDVKAEALKHSTVTNGDNIAVTETTNKDGGKEYKVALNNDIHLFGDNGAMVSISGSHGTIWTSGSVTAGSVVAGDVVMDSTTATVSGLGNKTTAYEGFANGKGKAATEEQLKEVATEAGKHSKVVNGSNINVEEFDNDGQKIYKVNLNKDIMLGDLTGKYVSISGTNGTIETTGYIATKDRVYADKGGKLADIDVTGNKISNGASSIVLDGSNVKVNDKVTIDQNGKISGVAAGEISSTSTDAINGSQLHQTNENVAANRADIDKNKADIAANRADIDKNKADIAANRADIAQNKTDIKNLDNRVTNVEELAKKHTTVTAGDNITVTEDKNKDGGKEYKVALDKDINLDSVTTGQTVMNNDGLKVGKDVSVNATAVTAGQTSISNDGLNVNGKTYVSDNGLNANEQKITKVAEGELSATSMDAVNGSQLYKTNQEVVNNTNRINKLGSRVNKVGAGAAALAALHPMDFDPDDKLTFSAGYGNYAGENAAAIGAYYRPDEKVMFSVAGTVGNGENMVNAGVSFALDRTNHVSNSRTALAREVIDLRGQLAVMGAKMAKMEKAFGMLDETKTKLFPDVPANHWAYEYIAKLAGNGYIEGYPDGNFGGDRLMTRYEFAAMLYRAIENGAALEEKIIKEFEPELGRIRVDRISGEDGDRDKIERVRVNDTKGERDHYGNKLAK